jgi:hypothetical protein
MGLLQWLRNRRMSDPVRGTLRVVETSSPDNDSVWTAGRIDGVISADGVAPRAIAHHGLLKTERWPWPGQDLPVTVDRADPTRLRILWDEIPSPKDTAAQEAQQLAEQMRSAGGAAPMPGPVPPFPPLGSAPGAPTTITVNGHPAQLTPDLAAFVRQAEELASRPPFGAQPGQPYGTFNGRPIDLSDPTRPAAGTPGGGTTPEQAAQLMITGERANATVLMVTPVSLPAGVPAPGVGFYDLVMDVARADGSHYQAKTRVGFATAERRDRVARAGVQIPLRIDPADLARVAVDTAALGLA